MDDELKELKSVLKSLVVSSPTQVDVRSLLRDYRNMVGGPLPVTKYGFRDPLLFIRERCNDCFVLQGPSSNPVLTLIVPETLKHIDKFVQKQKVSSTVKFKGKRRSIQGEIVVKSQESLIAKTFVPKMAAHKEESVPKPKPVVINTYSNNNSLSTKKLSTSTKPQELEIAQTKSVNISKSIQKLNIQGKENNQKYNKPINSAENGNSSSALHNFMRKRMPLYSSEHIESEKSFSCDRNSSKEDDDSGRQTSSSNSTSKAAKLEELKTEIKDLIANVPEGIWATDLIRLYRERFNRELNFSRFGYTSIISLVCVLEDVVHISRPLDTGDWLLRDPASAAAKDEGAAVGPGAHVRRYLPQSVARFTPSAREMVDPDDALPGIDFDPDVFPEDCMHFMESIPACPLDGVEAGAMLEVMVGEVYSPSHLWLLRLGDNYNIAMEDIMDQMTKYYTIGEGKERALAVGAVRVGHYCSSVYEGDWHRSLIVRVMDSDTVKVRHVDYGTVETVRASMLKPLRREWGALPAQAVRARLGGVRPPAGGRRWPHAASAQLLRLVRDRRLVANVVAKDREEDILEVFLIDTSTDDDICISSEMIRSGHADARPDSALGTSECYLFPRFEALETGATPNYGDIHAYLRDGIALEYVEDYRRHVPASLPPDLPSPPTPPSPSPPALEDTPLPDSESSSGECSSASLQPSSEDAPDPPSPRPALARAASSPIPCSPSPPPARVASAHTVLDAPAPALAPNSSFMNRVPLLQPAPTPRTPRAPAPGPRPRLPRPACTPLAHAYSQIMSPYAGFPPFPGAMPLFAPHYPPPMMVQPPYAQPPAFHAPPTPYPPPPLLLTSYSTPTPTPAPPPRLEIPICSSTSVQATSSPVPSASAPAPRPTETPRRPPSPPPPYNGEASSLEWSGPRTGAGAGGEITLSVSECEIYRLLSRVDAGAAHWYMADAISRAMRGPGAAAASTLNPDAAEFRLVAASTQTERPPAPPAAPRPAPAHAHAPALARLPPGMRPPPGFGLN